MLKFIIFLNILLLKTCTLLSISNYIVYLINANNFLFKCFLTENLSIMDGENIFWKYSNFSAMSIPGF